MGAPSKKVWELVHSLNASESQKFYDRAFEHKRGNYSYYVILYDALKEQKLFDEQKLRERLADQPFIGYLHRVKNYLYGRILEYVREARLDGESELYGLLDKLKFLFEKRLFHHLPDMIAKAEILAGQMEDFKTHIKILNYKRELLQIKKDWDQYASDVASLKEQEKELLEKEQERLDLVQMRDDLMGLSRIVPDLEVLKKIKVNLQKRESPKSRTAAIALYRVRYNLAMRIADYGNCITETDNIIEVFKNAPQLLQEYAHFKTFTTAVFYGANFRIYHRQFQDSDELMGLISSVGNAEKREPTLFSELKILHELAIGIKSLDLGRIEGAVTEFEKLPLEILHNLDPTSEIEINHLIAVALLVFEQPKRALKYINATSTAKPKIARKDLKQFARVLFIIAHFDLGNYDMVDQGVKAARIAFKRKGTGNVFFESAFKMFIQLSRASNKVEIAQSIDKFLAGFENENRATCFAMNNYFHLQAWSISKKEAEPFSKILESHFDFGL